MSERLEEIDRIVEGLYNDKIELRNFVQESLEQAERVQELEENKQLKVMYQNNTGAGMNYLEQNKRYREARKRIEEKYDIEYDIQSQEYMGGIADGLMIAMNIIDTEMEESE